MVEFKKYLHGASDAGSRLMFKFRSGTHGLNEELGRHRGGGDEGVPVVECESVSHALRECPAYSSLRSNFLVAQQGMGLSISSHLIVSGRHPLFRVVSCGRINLVLCLTLLRVIF